VKEPARRDWDGKTAAISIAGSCGVAAGVKDALHATSLRCSTPSCVPVRPRRAARLSRARRSAATRLDRIRSDASGSVAKREVVLADGTATGTATRAATDADTAMCAVAIASSSAAGRAPQLESVSVTLVEAEEMWSEGVSVRSVDIEESISLISVAEGAGSRCNFSRAFRAFLATRSFLRASWSFSMRSTAVGEAISFVVQLSARTAVSAVESHLYCSCQFSRPASFGTIRQQESLLALGKVSRLGEAR